MESVFSLERHQLLLMWTQCVGAYITEDGYDVVFTYGENPLPVLEVMDYHNWVIYLRASSETLGPGVWFGYLICPGELLPMIQNTETPDNNGSQWLLQQFLAELMQNQVFYTHVGKLVCSYATHPTLLRDGLSILLPEGKIVGVTAGLHLSLYITRHTELVTRL